MNGPIQKTACGLAVVPLLFLPCFYTNSAGEGLLQEEQQRRKDTQPPDLTGTWVWQHQIQGEGWVSMGASAVVAKLPKTDKHYSVTWIDTAFSRNPPVVLGTVAKVNPELYRGRMAMGRRKPNEVELKWDREHEAFVVDFGSKMYPDLWRLTKKGPKLK